MIFEELFHLLDIGLGYGRNFSFKGEGNNHILGNIFAILFLFTP